MINYPFGELRHPKALPLVFLTLLFLGLPTAGAQTQAQVDVLVQNGRQQSLEARKVGTEEAFQKAEATLTEALQLDANNVSALTYRGMVKLEHSGLLARKGSFEASGALTNEACADLDRAVKINPNDYQARLMRGSSYAQFPAFLNKGATAIEDLEAVTRHSVFAAQSAEARAHVYLVLGRAEGLAGQTEKARNSFYAAAQINPKSPDGLAAQQELDKLAASPLATDSQGLRRPDHFPELSSDISPIIVAATVTLPIHNYEKGRASLGPSMQKFLGQLEKQPGLLGMHTLMSMDHPGMLIILTWWKDKRALNDWFYGDVHRGIIAEYYGAGAAQQIGSDRTKTTMSQSGQISMELFTSLPGSVRYGGGLAPESVEKKKP